MNPRTQLRVARPTPRLERIAAMYADGLGLERLGAFRDHEGFDGIMLGAEGADYHLEFTHQPGHEAGDVPSNENLLVFYLPDQSEWQRRCEAMEAAGFILVSSHNPYWDRSGRSYEDPDGYRVVLQCAAWRDTAGES